MGFIEDVLNKIDDGKADALVGDVNEILLILQEEYKQKNKPIMNDAERDALRHYFGTIELSKEYGGTVAWLSGLLHEGLEFMHPGNKGEQSQADRRNNSIAIDDFNAGKYIELKDVVGDHTKLRSLIEKLDVPPPYPTSTQKITYTPKPPPARENVQTYDMGYNPALDRTDEE
tara:strand:- start:1140 stop:1658 length:519 start_codon:yes stop_codon:yes gene_type:complete